eukprot:Awhi_evm1s3998
MKYPSLPTQRRCSENEHPANEEDPFLYDEDECYFNTAGTTNCDGTETYQLVYAVVEIIV